MQPEVISESSKSKDNPQKFGLFIFLNDVNFRPSEIQTRYLNQIEQRLWAKGFIPARGVGPGEFWGKGAREESEKEKLRKKAEKKE